MRKWTCEVVQDFDGTYYANMYINNERVEGLPQYVDYRTLRKAIEDKTKISILKRKEMFFERYGRKSYAMIDATQCRRDCRVKIEDRLNGWKPCWD